MKPLRPRPLLALVACVSMALLSLFGATPADAGCCFRIRPCTGINNKQDCQAAGGKWARCPFLICKNDGSCGIGIRFSSTAESDAPSCRLTDSRSGPPAQIDITVQDTSSGLDEITVVEAENADVPDPSFDNGTTEPIVVTATKIDQSQGSRVTLAVGDVDGNCTLCDPVLTHVVTGKGRSFSEQSFPHISADEHVVKVSNGNPGLSSLEVLVNGTRFRLTRLKDDETRTLDVARAMLRGGHNIFTLRGNGKRGSQAGVIIFDGKE